MKKEIKLRTRREFFKKYPWRIIKRLKEEEEKMEGRF